MPLPGAINRPLRAKAGEDMFPRFSLAVEEHMALGAINRPLRAGIACRARYFRSFAVARQGRGYRVAPDMAGHPDFVAWAMSPLTSGIIGG